MNNIKSNMSIEFWKRNFR